jgi:hypothetical protein
MEEGKLPGHSRGREIEDVVVVYIVYFSLISSRPVANWNATEVLQTPRAA